MRIVSRPISFDDKLSALINLMIGVVLIGTGLWVRQKDADERHHWVETQGVVIKSISRQLPKSTDTTYAPVIEFEANGDRAQYIGAEKSYQFSEGKTVIIRYDPERPNEAARVIKPFDKFAPFAIMILGGTCVAIGAKKVMPFRLNRDQ